MTSPSRADAPASFTFAPIGYVRASRREKRLAPRQPGADGEPAVIELREGLDDAVLDLAGFSHIWVVWVFDQDIQFAPKVLPPRSSKKRGVLATRSPHRPNPIGLSAVRLLRVCGRSIHVDGVDMLDGTPVLDVKPYVAYVDAIGDASLGWLGEEGDRVKAAHEGVAPRADPIPAWNVAWSETALAQCEWLRARGINLSVPVNAALALGPEPHAYRRIRRRTEHSELSVKDWRVDFRTDGSSLRVLRIRSGYRAQNLEAVGNEVHRAFVEEFGAS